MSVTPFDEAAARRAATLHDELIRYNADIGVKDVMIAATCLERGLALLTMNERHFNRVSGLTVLTPKSLLGQQI
jgi:predicted nucleic acid-binding protein